MVVSGQVGCPAFRALLSICIDTAVAPFLHSRPQRDFHIQEQENFLALRVGGASGAKYPDEENAECEVDNEQQAVLLVCESIF
jgi:hypothetical protein